MRILIVSQYAVPPSETGITRHFSLARELVDRGHEVTILASSFQHWVRRETLEANAPDVHVEERDGIRFVRVRTPAYRTNSLARIGNMLAFARLVTRADVVAALPKPDVVLGSSPPLFAAWGALRLARRFAVPFVMEVRDMWPASLVHLGGKSPYNPAVLMLGVLEKHLYRQAAAVVSVLPAAGPAIAARGGRAESIAWIPNGVELGLLPAFVPPADHDGPWRVTYAGAHNLANALDTVVAAAALLEADAGGPAFQFTFIGDGPEKAALQADVARRGLRSVAFQPSVSKTEVYARLQNADFFVLALQPLALYRHGISINKMFDYLALGRPVVIASNAVNNPVADADAGIAVPAGDAVAMANAFRRLAALPLAERRKIGERGRAYIAAHHDTRELARRLEAVLDRASRQVA